MRIVGLDLSLTSTGVARLELDDDATLAGTWTETLGRDGEAQETLVQRFHRLDSLATGVAVAIGDPDLVVVETYAPRAIGGHPHDRSGLWWLVVHRILAELPSTRVAQVDPMSLKVYATGSGRPDKGKTRVMRDVTGRYGDRFDIPRGRRANDVCDAVALAAMGARWAGQPIDPELPALNLRAMTSAKWPTRPTPEGLPE